MVAIPVQIGSSGPATDPATPLIQGTAERADPPEAAQKEILIVDDEPRNLRLLEVILAPERLRLLTAANGEEALAMVARHPPDLILLDVMMPGMNGYQVADRLKSDSATRNIPIIVITALYDRNAKLLALSAGAEEFITRPVDRDELCMRVRNLLRLADQAQHTETLRAEVSLRTATMGDSERLYRSTFDAVPVGIVHVGLDGQWLRVNQRICDLLGFSREQLESGSARELTQSEDVAGESESLREMAAGTLNRHVLDEKRYRRKDGGVMWARVNMAMHRDAQGQPKHFILVIEDITEWRTLEAQVRQATKMDAIGRLASGVAHDFNNLLAVIIACADAIAEDGAMVERHGQDLDEIAKTALRAAGLTRQLLAFARQQVLLAAPVDVNGLITDMTVMLGRLIGNHIRITLKLAPNLPPAFVDRGQLEQVVMNLVVNARDAMPDGGAVTIETANIALENSEVHEDTIMQGNYVMLAITDTGTGMSQETKRRLFEPFFTTKEQGKGTGLGLSTTYGIVKQSKGYIWVYSEPDKGTTFKVYLPRSP